MTPAVRPCHGGDSAGLKGNHGGKIALSAASECQKRRPAKKRVRQSAGKARKRASVVAPGVVEAALAAFAHEVRTPLTGILAISDLLATSDLGERERRWVDTIKAGAEHLASLATLFVDAAKDRNAARPALRAGFVRPAGAGAQRRRFAGRPRGGERACNAEVEISDELAGARGRRSRPLARRAGKPDRQCGEVHRSAAALRCESRRCAGTKGKVGVAFAVSDSGIGLTLDGDQAPVPPVLAGQCHDRLALRRRRARTVLGQAARARDGRRHQGRAAARWRRHLHADGDLEPREGRRSGGDRARPRPPPPIRCRRCACSASRTIRSAASCSTRS